MKFALSVALVGLGVQAETFHSTDGVVFEGTIRRVVSRAAVCNVVEENHTPEEYERLKGNQGRPLDLWQVDFAVRKGDRIPAGLRLGSLGAAALHELERRGAGGRAGPAGVQFADPDRVGGRLPGAANAERDAPRHWSPVTCNCEICKNH